MIFSFWLNCFFNDKFYDGFTSMMGLMSSKAAGVCKVTREIKQRCVMKLQYYDNKRRKIERERKNKLHLKENNVILFYV